MSLETCLASAADVDEAAGRVRRIVGEQPDDRARHFDRLAGALHRQRRAEAVGSARLSAARMNLRADDPRTDAVDADALRGDFFRQTDGQRVERGF